MTPAQVERKALIYHRPSPVSIKSLMRLLAFNGFSGDSDATCVLMQSPRFQLGFTTVEGIKGCEGGKGVGTKEVEQPEGRRKKRKTSLFAHSVSVGSALRLSRLVLHVRMEGVVVRGQGSSRRATSRPRWITGLQLSS